MLQSIYPERLRNKEGSGVDAWISLGRGTIMDFVYRLGAGEDVNMSDWMGEDGGREH